MNAPAAPARPALGSLRRYAVAAVVVLFALVVGAATATRSYDDAWITYRYAYNFAAGDGLVYNPGERLLGTSAPGYALLLGVLAMPSPDLVPVLSGAVAAVALAAAGLAFVVYGEARRMYVAGTTSALLFVVNPLALESMGGEMLPQAALALWAVVAMTIGRPWPAVVCALGAAILRPDGLLALALTLSWALRDRRWSAWPQVVAAGAVLAVWFGGLWLYFGEPLPSTLAAKQAQRVSGAWNAFGTDFGLWLLALTPYDTPFTVPRTHSGFAAFLALAVSGLVILPFRRAWWPLAAWPLAACLAYRQMRLPFYHWYAVPPLVLMAIASGLACDAGVRVLAAAAAWWRPVPAIRRTAPVVAAVIVVAAILVASVRPLTAIAFDTRNWFPGPGERAYIAIGQWLAANTPARASIGFVEIGFVGYHARRRMVEPFGLVTPQAAAGVLRGDFLHAYRLHRPDVILHSPVYFPGRMSHLEREEWFRREYVPVSTLESGRGYPLTVWRRVAPGG